MTSQKESTNKISQPKLSGIFKRKRLFKLLDENCRHPVIWISGPAGAGKTTLAASYLESRRIPCIWYQIDARDSDPATFFYYMNLAVKKVTPRKRKHLPRLTPEHLFGLDQFALQYFEIVYERLNMPFVLVIDNYQIIPSESILHSLICNGLSIIPKKLNVFIISRGNPPAVYSRMRANQQMALIGWDQIRLTQEETVGISRLRTGKTLPEESLHSLHEAAHGWAAGLMLMLAQSDLKGIDRKSIRDFTPQEVFDYFGNEVFEKETPEVQNFLLRCALLPHMTPKMAKALTGHSQSQKILSQLNRSNRFTEKRFEKGLSYQLHPMFRDFLLSRSEDTFSENEFAKLRSKAAELLQAGGDAEEAVVLLRDAKDWDLLAQLIINHASLLISQGRNLTLLEWLGFLPQEEITKNAWLGYWMGTTLTPFDPETSQSLLENAFESFRSDKDATGVYLSWHGIVEAIFFKMEDLSLFDHWIDVLEELMTEHKKFPNKEIESKIVSVVPIVLGYRQMHHPKMKYWIDQAYSLLHGPLDLHLKIPLINIITLYYCLNGEYDKAAHIKDMLGPAALSDQMEYTHPLAGLSYLAISAFYYFILGMHTQCLETVSKCLEFSKKTNVSMLDNVTASYGAWSAILHEDYDTAKELFEKNALSIANTKPLDRALIDLVRSMASMGSGDLNQAAVHASFALHAAENTGVQFSIILCRLLSARVMHEKGDLNEASDHLSKARELTELTQTRHLMFHTLMLEARFALDKNNKKNCMELLRKALALGKEINLYHNIMDSRSSIARLFTFALEHGIEEDYVKEYIQKRNLAPDIPPVHLKNWPWSIKIFTLSRFSLVKNGSPVRFSTKAQKKPLEMLKALIALGGRDISRTQISDALWPDAEGDKAERSFDTTLYRLRRLLDNEQALQIQDGKLTLNSSICWVDCWAFERLLSQADNLYQKDEDKAMELTEKALRMYIRPFLSGDEWAPWSVSQRERLRSKFLLAINRHGKHLEARGDLDRAVEYYNKSLGIEDLSEETYQNLMQCLIKMGKNPEAISVYNRCKKILNAGLGLKPSLETQEIYQSLLNG